ncbi:hypothetical protein DRH14_00245 [Candidatus Shapirobacteria bacterium]|nr:MAG: hypothetical protein DRH14_00245 [Candidatus Shapirobacteria bacterium]
MDKLKGMVNDSKEKWKSLRGACHTAGKLRDVATCLPAGRPARSAYRSQLLQAGSVGGVKSGWGGIDIKFVKMGDEEKPVDFDKRW